MFTATPMSSRTWGTGPFQVVTRRYVLSCMSQSRTTGQTHSKLDVETSRLLFYSEAASRRSPILCRPVWRARRFQSYHCKGQKSRLFASSRTGHLTALEQSYRPPLLRYEPTEIGILERSCDVVRHGNQLENASTQSSFECIDFQRLCQIIANLTHESLAEREAEIRNLPWTQTEKDTASARCRGGQRAWRNKKPVLSLSAVTDEDGHPLENEDKSGRRLCEYWSSPI